MADVTTAIDSSGGGDYGDIGEWIADLDNGAVYSAGDNAIGEGYVGSGYTDAETFTGGDTIGLASAHLTVNSGERHDGTEGTGAVTTAGADGINLIVNEPTGVAYQISWWEWDFNGHRGHITSAGSTFTNVAVFDHIIAHGFSATAGAPTTMVDFEDRDACWMNSIAYDYSRDSAGSMAMAKFDCDQAAGGVFNSTFVGAANPNATGNCTCVDIVSDDSDGQVKNVIAMDASVGGSGTVADFTWAGSTNVTSSNNLSSDATASGGGGSGHVESVASSDQFVNNVTNFHLVSDADAVDAGVDLGAGVWAIDIDGRDRDAQGDIWDIGADEFVGTGQTASPNPVTSSWSVVTPQINVTVPVSPVTATWSVPAVTVPYDQTASPSPVSATWAVAAPQINVTVPAEPVSATWSVPAVTIAAGQTVAVTPVTVTWSVPAPQIDVTVPVNPVAATWSVPVVAIATGQTVVATPVVVTWSVPSATINVTVPVSSVVATWAVPSVVVISAGTTVIQFTAEVLAQVVTVSGEALEPIVNVANESLSEVVLFASESIVA